MTGFILDPNSSPNRGNSTKSLGASQAEPVFRMAYALVYLDGDDSRMVTGQVLPVDSGVTIS